MKIEQRKVRGPEWGPQVKQTALLASPVYIGQAQGMEKKKHIKREAKIARGASLRVFWVGLPSRLKDVFTFACQIKLSCNTGQTVTSNFCCGQTEPRKLQIPLTPFIKKPHWRDGQHVLSPPPHHPAHPQTYQVGFRFCYSAKTCLVTTMHLVVNWSMPPDQLGAFSQNWQITLSWSTMKI